MRFMKLEMRQVFEAEDFGAELAPEMRFAEERLRAATDQRANGAEQR